MMLKSRAITDTSLLKHLQETFRHISKDDVRWHATDNKGNTWLHQAAISLKPKSIAWLMQENLALLDRRNDAGETPLEALECQLEHGRTKLRRIGLTIDISDQFKGFDEDSVACLIHLRGLNKLSETERQCLKYGCTCGKCVNGFLSPRMAYAIRGQAEELEDVLGESGDEFLGSMLDFGEDESLQYVPRAVRQNMKTNKSMRQGFASLFGYFAACVKRGFPLILPNEENISEGLLKASEWPPHSKNYLQRGGTIYAVGSYVFQKTMDEDEIAGDGDPIAGFDDFLRFDKNQMEDIGGLRAELDSLPTCRNDLEYGFVSAMCGYKRVSRVPYT
jgi:hypothetical protein